MKKLIQKPKRLALALVLVLSMGFATSFTADNYFEVSKNLDIFATLVKEVNTFYVDQVNPSKLMRVGIDAMLNELDPYTTFISESEIEDYKFMMTGAYGGVGAIVSRVGDYVTVIEPYEGWPAAESGLRAGDHILEIDGQQMTGKNSTDVSDLLKGTPGTEVELLVQRPGREEPFNVTVTRKKIKVDNVPYYGMVNDHIGYIQFRSFRQNAAKEVEDALQTLKEKHDLRGVILDVRGNPGGLLMEAVNAVNIFIPKNKLVVETRGKVEEWVKNYHTQHAATDEDIPLAVLTNGRSASASEIVSGAIQDHDRGVIIGQQTFGKGLVQTTRPLSYNTQLKITTAKYYIPSGRCIQRIDYSHRDENGDAAEVPDSLISEYRTLGGRTVFDGCGITPDIKTDRESYAEITKTLMNKRHIFNFATQYRNAHESIPPAKEFNLTDQDFEDFVAYLQSKDYSYETGSERMLEKLRKEAKDEEYLAAIEDELELVEKQLKHNKEADLRTHKDEVITLLEQEIVSRYYYNRGQIEVSLRTDPEVAKAIEVLQNQQEYGHILTSIE